MGNTQSTGGANRKIEVILKSMDAFQYENALSLLDDYIQTEGASRSEGFYLKALCYSLLGCLADAGKALGEAFEGGEISPQGCCLRAWVNFCLGRFEEAAKDYAIVDVNKFCRLRVSGEVLFFSQFSLMSAFFGNRAAAEDGLRVAVTSSHELVGGWVKSLPYVVSSYISGQGSEPKYLRALIKGGISFEGCPSYCRQLIRPLIDSSATVPAELSQEDDSSCDFHWVKLFQAQLKFHRRDYQGALQLCLSLPDDVLYKQQEARDLLSCIIGDGVEELLSFRSDEGEETLLHIACKLGEEKLIECVMKSAESQANPNEYIVQRDSDGNTPLCVLLKHGHKRLADLVMLRTSKASFEKPGLLLESMDLLNQIKKGGSRGVMVKREGGTGVKKPRVWEEAFHQQMSAYKKEIELLPESSKERGELCQRATKLALKKFREDVKGGNNAPSKESGASSIQFLQGFINLRVKPKMGDTFGFYLTELVKFLEVVGALQGGGGVPLAAGRLLKGDDKGGSLLSMMPMCVNIYSGLKQENYGKVFKPLVAMFKMWADSFGAEDTKEIARELFECAEDFHFSGKNDDDFLDGVYRFSQHFQSTATKHAVEILGSGETLKSMLDAMRQHIKQDKPGEVSRDYCCLIYVILTSLPKDNPFYQKSAKLRDEIKVVVKKYVDVEAFVNKNKVDQYAEIASTLSRMSSQCPNPLLLETAEAIKQHVRDYKSTKQKSSIFIFVKLISRFFINYGKKHDSSISYAGFIGLFISQSCLIFDTIRHEKSRLAQFSRIAHEVESFIQEIPSKEGGIAGNRMLAVAAVVSMLLDIANQWSSWESGKVLSELRSTLWRYELRFASISNRDGAKNDVLIQAITKILTMSREAVVLGEGVKVILSLFRGEALATLKDNLSCYLPEGVSDMAIQGVGKALQGLPVVGGMLSAVAMQNEFKELKRDIKNQISELEMSLSSKLVKMEERICSQMGVGFSAVFQGLGEVLSEISLVQDNLKSLGMLQKQHVAISKANLMKDYFKTLKNIRFLVISSAQTNSMIAGDAARVNFDKLAKFMLPGGGDSIFSVHHKDWLIKLNTSLNRRFRAKLYGDCEPLPNFNHWCQSAFQMTTFLNRVDPKSLFNMDCDLTVLAERVFGRAMAVQRFVRNLRSPEVLLASVQSISVEVPAEEDLEAFIILGSLLGVPLSGYGEDVFWWKSDLPVACGWRKTMGETVVNTVAQMQNSHMLEKLSQVTDSLVCGLGAQLLRHLECYKDALSMDIRGKRSVYDRCSAVIDEIGQQIQKVTASFHEGPSCDSGYKVAQMWQPGVSIWTSRLRLGGEETSNGVLDASEKCALVLE